jgi:acyl phosphate:glycerol-3-phosphate acyltransferase
MQYVYWTAIGFLLGSIPFSVMIGDGVKKVDIRKFGDHNPGSTNVIRAMGWGWGIIALLLDVLKATIPVGIAWFIIPIHGCQMIPIALSPVFGHAFSPWLKFKGGKAVASTFGVWIGLTLGVIPTVLGMLLGLMYIIFKVSSWAVISAMICLGIFIYSYYGRQYPEFVWIWFGIFFILLYKHRSELSTKPSIRSELIKKIFK